MASKPRKAKNGYVLPTEKFKQREKVFGLYRDNGEERPIASPAAGAVDLSSSRFSK
jgi:hypothetical protein